MIIIINLILFKKKSQSSDQTNKENNKFGKNSSPVWNTPITILWNKIRKITINNDISYKKSSTKNSSDVYDGNRLADIMTDHYCKIK